MGTDPKEAKSIIYIDTGGTFSDCVFIEEDGSITSGKAPTTPENLAECFINCLEATAKSANITLKEMLSQTGTLGFGTTAGTNALLVRLVEPKLGMITTKGLEDVVHMMRAFGRVAGLFVAQQMHMSQTDKPKPLIEKRYIKGVEERIDSRGEVVIPLRDEEVKRAVKALVDDKVEGIAVCLLWSFINNKHEQRIKEIIKEMTPDMPVSLSSEIAPLMREYPRFNSAIINLYVGKPIKKLFDQVTSKLKELSYKNPLLVMQASGGLSRSEVIHPVSTLQSGPVGGLVGVDFMKKLYGFENAIGTDMGGTSFDISLLPKSGPEYVKKPVVARFNTSTPMIETISIGAGGGSIARVDPISKRLTVGPQGAGSDPGPVSYKRGGVDPTVTDADLVMNRIDPNYFLGGKMKLYRELALEAIEKKIAEPLGFDVYGAAQAICNIVDDSMGYQLRLHIRERGMDPQKFALLSFGGAGPTHCAGYVTGLNFMKVIIPTYAAVFSAFGASTADIAHRYQASPNIVIPSVPYSAATLRFEIDSLDQIPAWAIERYNDTFNRLINEAYKDMENEGFKREDVSFRFEVEMRYGGQLWEQIIHTDIGCIEKIEDLRSLLTAYEDHYERAYGFAALYPRAGFEIITLVVSATVSVPNPKITKKKLEDKNPKAAYKGKRDVYFRDHFEETKIYDMRKLKAGNFIEGPAIIEGVDTNVVIPLKFTLETDEYINMVLTELS